MKVVISKVQARDPELVNGFFLKGWDIEVRPERRADLPPLVRQDWQGGRINAQQLSSGAIAQERNLTVVVDNRPEDGVMHVRAQGLSYTRRPSKVGRPLVQCKSWTDGEYDKLAGLVCSGNLDQLLAYLAANGVPGKSTCEKVATALDRPVSSVAAKLRDLRRKALVSGK